MQVCGTEHVSLDVAGRSPEQTLGKELDLPASWGRGWRADVLIRPGMIPEALKAGASPREKLREMETEAKGTMKRKVSQGERSKREVAVRVGRRRWRMGLSQGRQEGGSEQGGRLRPASLELCFPEAAAPLWYRGCHSLGYVHEAQLLAYVLVET